MLHTTVYFATNRVVQGPTADWRNYSAEIVPPTDAGQLTYAAAFVDGTDLLAEGSGAIATISNAQSGSFQAGVAQDILGSGRSILLFVHGFANSFANSITRAAYNRAWFAASGVNAADTTVIAFSWPSLGQLFATPPHLLPEDYLRDQSQAGRSGFHIASFLTSLQPLLTTVRTGGRRVFLLTHSMGALALQGAVESWFSHGRPAATLFDEAFLAAGDERYDSFEFPMGARLSRLADLAPRISIYSSVRDVALYLQPYFAARA